MLRCLLETPTARDSITIPRCCCSWYGRDELRTELRASQHLIKRAASAKPGTSLQSWPRKPPQVVRPLVWDLVSLVSEGSRTSTRLLSSISKDMLAGMCAIANLESDVGRCSPTSWA
jgi:hypothetical protein